MAQGQTSSGYATQGGEYRLTDPKPGDQVRPAIAIGPAGGYVVSEDNATDGYGLGVFARRLDGSLSGAQNTFQVNATATDDQERARVTLLPNGGAVFAWQGGRQGFQQIYARVLRSNNTWLTSDIRLNATPGGNHLDVSLATLADGNVIAVWGSFNQISETSLQDVFAQRLSPNGSKAGGEFRINDTSAFNQRSPVVASLPNGDFVVAWISEQQRFLNSVDLYARIFDANGSPKSPEILVNTSTSICANPSVTAGAGDRFAIVWCERDPVVKENGWDVWARSFTSAGAGGTAMRVNGNTYGDQTVPQIASSGSAYLAVWTSQRQDGSADGVFGRFLGSDAALLGPEMQVNTTSISKQMHPAVAADNSGRFNVAWTSFAGLAGGFDLYAQRFSASTATLAIPEAPLVSAVDSSELSITWPAVSGLSVIRYDLYEDGSQTPSFSTTNNYFTRDGLVASTTKSFRLAYVVSGGGQSPLSAAGLGTTWGVDANGDGVPDDWQTLSWGANPDNWPAVDTDSDGDGASNLKEFLAGTSPTDEQKVFKQSLDVTAQGMFLRWNTQPGLVYQVETSTNISDAGSWVKLGEPRFAVGGSDQIPVTSSSSLSNYRVRLLR